MVVIHGEGEDACLRAIAVGREDVVQVEEERLPRVHEQRAYPRDVTFKRRLAPAVVEVPHLDRVVVAARVHAIRGHSDDPDARVVAAQSVDTLQGLRPQARRDRTRGCQVRYVVLLLRAAVAWRSVSVLVHLGAVANARLERVVPAPRGVNTCP
eukprot:scaffold96220_cov69-Phaeocystis_antarctica.AAC.1